MTKVVTAPSTSLDGLIAGADDSPEQRLGVDGDRLFSWFSDGDTPSRYYLSFKMSSARPSSTKGSAGWARSSRGAAPTTSLRRGAGAHRRPASR
jgi:hypothetical protein